MGFEKGVGERVNVNSEVICSNEKKCRLEIYKGLLIGSKELENIFLPGASFHGYVIFFSQNLDVEVE